MRNCTWIIVISAGVKVTMFARDSRTPSIVNDHLIFDRTIVVKPSQEIGGVPVHIVRLPIAIRPNDTWLVGIHL